MSGDYMVNGCYIVVLPMRNWQTVQCWWWFNMAIVVFSCLLILRVVSSLIKDLSCSSSCGTSSYLYDNFVLYCLRYVNRILQLYFQM